MGETVAVFGDLVFGGVSTVSYRGWDTVVLDCMGFGWDLASG